MKTYRIRIILQSGTTAGFTEETITSNLTSDGYKSTNYTFCDDDGLYKYYPTSCTIIEELKNEKPTISF